MHTYVITAGDYLRIADFLRHFQPLLFSEHEQMNILRDKLDGAIVVPDSKLSRTIVSMYSTVKVTDLTRRETAIHTLVYPAEASPARRRISLLSPLGTALLGLNQGDIFECTVPEGTIKHALREVLFQPEWSSRPDHGLIHDAPAS